MGLYKAISVAAFGMASYALYKTGALNPIVKSAVKAGEKANEVKNEVISKAKEGYNDFRAKMADGEVENTVTTEEQPLTGEIV